MGLVLGIMANKKGKTGMATAGIIISIVALVLSVASVVISLVFADALKEYMEKAGYPM